MGIGTELGQTSTEQNPTFSTLVRPDTTSCLSRRFRSIHRLGGAAVEGAPSRPSRRRRSGLGASRSRKWSALPSPADSSTTFSPARGAHGRASGTPSRACLGHGLPLAAHDETLVAPARPGPGPDRPGPRDRRWPSGRAEGWWRPRSVSCKAGPACPSVPRGLTAVDVQDDSRHE